MSQLLVSDKTIDKTDFREIPCPKESMKTVVLAIAIFLIATWKQLSSLIANLIPAT